MTSPPFYDLIGRAGWGLTALTFARASSFTCAGKFSWPQLIFSVKRLILKLEAQIARKFTNNSNKVCSPKAHLHPSPEQGLISRCRHGASTRNDPALSLTLCWPIPRTEPHLSPRFCTLVAVGGWKWRGRGAAMITHTLHGRAG